jgi:hypothetical protein
MNERLKEIAIAAQVEHCISHVRLTEFAELIVKECAGVYSKIDNGNLHMGTDNYLEALQKHFGVEK